MASESSDGSCDEDKSDGKRRRFCIERKQEEEQQKLKTNVAQAQRQPNSRKANLSRIKKLPKSNHVVSRNSVKNEIGKTSGIARRKFNNNSNNTQPNNRFIPSTTSKEPEVAKDSSRRPVIYINPKFVKRFLEKSLELASLNDANNSIRSLATNKSSLDNNDAASRSANQTLCMASELVPIPSSSSTNMIEDIDFKTKPRESLKAASMMAIIRLVTECIEDTRKRDENLNRTLVSQLIDKLVYGERVDPSTSGTQCVNQTHTNKTQSQHKSAEISQKDDVSEGTGYRGGQPIPVIGGSVNQHFNKNTATRTFYSPRRHNPYQRSPRIGNDRNNEIQNKVKNLSTQ